MSAADDWTPLRRLAAERGRVLGELGLRADDDRWCRLDAEAIASLVKPGWRVRLPAFLLRWAGRLRRGFH